MTTTFKFAAEQIIELCSNSIDSIRQIAWKSDIDSTAVGKVNVWGGCAPIIEIIFGDENNSCLFVGATDTSLVFRSSHSDDYDAVLSLANQIEEGDYDSDDLIGTFDLDSVVCPVPEWENLGITKALVITTDKDNTVVGLCLWVNLGIRIGLFVAPNPGITLSFNDTCDSILRQAEKAQQDGLVHIVSKEFSNKETPKQIDTIEWFDWLRQKN
ncbi:hypothetical protein [uncultured Gimesia sp.]|mgnify:CR=1 FL=1|uniref:hypothetical protein n=1 Tax=uncultured Gimesia sp. TaxID=1678688 RepID=UPI002634FC9A|nr:hypothetical protein [uncultured Gimesia sp.]